MDPRRGQRPGTGHRRAVAKHGLDRARRSADELAGAVLPARAGVCRAGSGFPESPAYAERMAAMMAQRHGPVYVMLQTNRSDLAETSAEVLRAAAEQNAGVLGRAGEILARYRLRLDAASCRSYPAYVGSNRWPYQLCLVERAGQ